LGDEEKIKTGMPLAKTCFPPERKKPPRMFAGAFFLLGVADR